MTPMDPRPVQTHAQPPEIQAECRCGWKGTPAAITPAPGCLPILRCPDCARQATPITDRDAGDEQR